jgi:hypothetical protein
MIAHTVGVGETIETTTANEDTQTPRRKSHRNLQQSL